MRDEDLAPAHADRARRQHEVVLALREHGAPQETREDRDVDDADRDHHLEEAGPEQGDDPDRHQEAGNRQHDVDEPHRARLSTQPPKKPEIEPSTIPIDRPTVTETMPISSDSRAP